MLTKLFILPLSVESPSNKETTDKKAVEAKFSSCNISLSWLRDEPEHGQKLEPHILSFSSPNPKITTPSKSLEQSGKTPQSSGVKRFLPHQEWVKGNTEVQEAAVKQILSGTSWTKTLLENFVSRWLLGRVFLPGNAVVVPICGLKQRFQTWPDVVCESFEFSRQLELWRIDHSTTVRFADERPNADEIIKSEVPTEIVDRSIPPSNSKINFKSLGGLTSQIAELRDLVELPLTNPKVFKAFGIRPPRGVLLYGPPGTGKTTLAKAVAHEFGAKLYVINGPELISEYFGESEQAIVSVFEEAQKNAPAIVRFTNL